MGRKKRTIIEEEAEPSDKEVMNMTPDEEAELLAQEKTAELLADFQERFADQPAKVLVEKYDIEGDWAICRKYPLAGFEQENVKAEFGGGKYRGTLLDATGRYVKGGRITFKFADSVVKESQDKKADNPLENPVVVMMLESMKSQQNTMLELTKSMIAAQATAPTKGGTLGEVVEVVKSLNSMGPKDKPLDNFKETLGLVKLLKEATTDSDSESSGGIFSQIKEFLEVVPALKDQLAQMKPPVGGPSPVGAPGPLPAEVNPNGLKEIRVMDPLTKKVVELVPKFVGGARANAPIGEWGSFLLDAFDTEVLPVLLPVLKEKYPAFVKDEDDAYDIVLRLAKEPNERAKVFSEIKPLAPYTVWVNQVIDEAIRLAETPEETPVEVVNPENGSVVTH